MHSVRSLASSNLQLFTTSTGSRLILPQEEVRDWPKHVIGRHPRWKSAAAVARGSHSPSIARGRGRTDRRAIFYELSAHSKFVWMPSGRPERRFSLARQELGPAKRQEVVKEANCLAYPQTVPPYVLLLSFLSAARRTLSSRLRSRMALRSRITGKSVTPPAASLLSNENCPITNKRRNGTANPARMNETIGGRDE